MSDVSIIFKFYLSNRKTFEVSKNLHRVSLHALISLYVNSQHLQRECMWHPFPHHHCRTSEYKARVHHLTVMANEFTENREGTANLRHATLTSSLDLSTSLDHSVQTRIFKIIVIGDSNVGKTCLTFRFTGGSFPCKTEATIGVDFREKAVEIEGEKIKVGFCCFLGQCLVVTRLYCVFQWMFRRQKWYYSMFTFWSMSRLMTLCHCVWC